MTDLSSGRKEGGPLMDHELHDIGLGQYEYRGALIKGREKNWAYDVSLLSGEYFFVYSLLEAKDMVDKYYKPHTGRWTKEKPTEAGYCWFYGYPDETHRSDKRKPKLYSAKVAKLRDGLLLAHVYGYDYVINDMVGYWLEIETPEIPKDMEF